VIAAIIADVDCAYLAYMIAKGRDKSHGVARYALSAFFVRSLIERELKVLLVDGTLWATPGLQYFQRRLGFSPYNIRIAADRHDVPAYQMLPVGSAAYDAGIPFL
jgi:hypothetical protein